MTDVGAGLMPGPHAYPMSMNDSLRTTTHALPGMTVLDHRLTVPLDHSGLLDGFPAAVRAALPREITVFAREFVRDGHEDAPRMVFFQGGPGSAGQRPAPIGGWESHVLDSHRLVVVDERGTGQSHALDAARVTAVGDAETQAAYLSCFRADSIVDDAEALRRALQGDEPWTALGQSFGGFCVTTYLSRAPRGLAKALITAGLPALTAHCDHTYRLTWAETEKRNAEFFARYPADEAMAWRIARHLEAETEYLPTGERLSPRRFRMLGIVLGYSYGLEKLHYLLEDPFVQVGGRERLSSRFLVGVGGELTYGGAPMYWSLHESIYAQPSTGATNWSAHRIREEFPQFAVPASGVAGAAESETAAAASGAPFRFSGEHVFPWQGEEDPALVPFADAVHALAARTDLPALHDPAVLAENSVPAAAWVYREDMFVPYAISMETAEAIKGMKVLVSDEYHHDALRTVGADLVQALLDAVN